MLDIKEAEAMVLGELNPDNSGTYAIHSNEEKPYGWVFYVKRADGEPLPPGGATCFVVEKETGEVSKLSGSFLRAVLAEFEQNL